MEREMLEEYRRRTISCEETGIEDVIRTRKSIFDIQSNQEVIIIKKKNSLGESRESSTTLPSINNNISSNSNKSTASSSGGSLKNVNQTSTIGNNKPISSINNRTSNVSSSVSISGGGISSGIVLSNEDKSIKNGRRGKSVYSSTTSSAIVNASVYLNTTTANSNENNNSFTSFILANNAQGKYAISMDPDNNSNSKSSSPTFNKRKSKKNYNGMRIPSLAFSGGANFSGNKSVSSYSSVICEDLILLLKVQDYLIFTKELGSGGCGKVYLAAHLQTQTPVAVKLIDTQRK